MAILNIMKNKYGRSPFGSLVSLSLGLLIAVPAGAVISSKPRQIKKYVALGFKDLKQDDYDGAVVRFAQAVKLSPTSKAYFLLGYAHYQRGFRNGPPVNSRDIDDAMATINAYTVAMTIDPKLSHIRQPYLLYYTLGMSYEAVNANGKALRAYKRAIATAHNNYLIPLYAARLRYQMNDKTASAANLHVAINRAQRTHQEEELIDLVNGDSHFAAMMQNPVNQRVLASATSFDKLFPQSRPDTGYGLRDAISNRSQRTHKNALDEIYDMRDAVSDRPRSAPNAALSASFVDPAVAEKIAYGDDAFKSLYWHDAVTAYQQALLRDENIHTLNTAAQAAINVKIGACYNKLGQPDEAVKALKNALEMGPFSAEGHYQLALAYAMSGRPNSAIDELNNTFSTAGTSAEQRRHYRLLAKTDSDFAAIRDLPVFQKLTFEPTDIPQLSAR